MKIKYVSFSVLALVAIVAVAHAARTNRNPTIIDETIVSPLDGYADQIGSDYMAPVGDLLAPSSESLLDEPTD